MKNCVYINRKSYNPSKFSMDNAWTSNPTCANMTLEIPTSNRALQTNIVRQTLFNSDDLFTVPA